MNLYPHQQDAIKAIATENKALLHACGLGKTVTALLTIQDYLKTAPDPVLVVCTKKLIDAAWLEDAQEFTPDIDIVGLWANSREKRKKILHGDHQVYVTNYDTLRNNFDMIQDRKFGMMFVDESSKMKQSTSLITQAILSLSGFRSRKNKFPTKNIIPRRYALSGTPAPNSPEEYWAQVKLVTGPGNRVFSDNFYAFRARFFYTIDLGNRRKMFKFRQQTFEEFCHKLARAVHIARKDVLGLKPQEHRIHDIPLSTAEKAAYETMKKDLVLTFGTEDVLASTALVEVMKLRQIASGFVYGDSGTHRIGSSKLDAMRELLKADGSEQSLIWVNFREEAAMLGEIPGAEVLPDGDSIDTIRAFKEGKFPYLIANPQSAGHGLTFTNCHHSRYNSLSYSFELMLQSRERTDRIGQKNACVYDYLMAEGTIDRVVYQAVKRKELMVDKFMEYLLAIQNGTVADKSDCDRLFAESHGQMLRKDLTRYLKGA